MRKRIVLITAAILFSITCTDGPTEALARAPSDVRSFLVADTALVVRGVAQIPLAAKEVLLYRVSYGQPQDCLSGCFYATAHLLRLGPRIGWLERLNEVPNAVAFRFESGDPIILSTDVLADLRRRDIYAYRALTQALSSTNVAR